MSVTVSPAYSSLGVRTTGFLPRSGTYSRPCWLGVSTTVSLLAKLNSFSVAGVFSIERAPSAPSTILAV